MKIDFSESGTEGIFKVTGTLNLHSLNDFDLQIKALDLSQIKSATLDLQDLEHIDSSGVSGIIQLQRILYDKNIKLKIASISTRVEKLFEQMSLFDIIPRV